MQHRLDYPWISGTLQAGRRVVARGVTLIELMVAVGLLAIIMTAAVPAFDSVILSNRLTGYSTEFIATVQAARSEAIKRNQRVVICVSADGASCASGGWHQGWLVFHDVDGDGVPDSGEEIIKVHEALATGYLFKDAAGATKVTFDGSGALASALSLKLCRSTTSPGPQDRQVDVSLTGRPNVAKTATGSCS